MNRLTMDIIDAAADDGSKDFVWEQTDVRVLWIYIKLVTSADVGNRTMVLEVLDNTASPVVRFYVPLAPNIAAGVTRYMVIQPGLQHEASFGGPNSDHIHAPMPDMAIRAGWTLRIRDSAAIALTADDMTVYGQVVEA